MKINIKNNIDTYLKKLNRYFETNDFHNWEYDRDIYINIDDCTIEDLDTNESFDPSKSEYVFITRLNCERAGKPFHQRLYDEYIEMEVESYISNNPKNRTIKDLDDLNDEIIDRLVKRKILLSYEGYCSILGGLDEHDELMDKAYTILMKEHKSRMKKKMMKIMKIMKKMKMNN